MTGWRWIGPRALAVLLAGALAGCAAPAVAPDGPRVADSAAGNVLTDANGMTLYVFDKDAKGQSNCTGVCATLWPPAKAGPEARPAHGFSLITRSDGARQWAYHGMPLYGYVRDGRPGDATGDGAGGVWHAARP